MSKSLFDLMAADPVMQRMMVEADARRDTRAREAIQRYGSKEAIFAETEQERLLSAALEPFKVWAEWTDETGVQHSYVESLGGANGVMGKRPAEVLAAAAAAYPVPDTISGVLEEDRTWDELYLDRSAFGGYDHWFWVQVRGEVLRDALMSRPAQSFADVEARLDWMTDEAENGLLDQHHLETLQADIRRLRIRGERSK